MKKLFFLTFFILLFLNISSQDNGLYSLMKERNEFYFKFECDIQHLADISDVISIDKVDGNKVVAYANKQEYEKFLTLGFETTLLTRPSMLENHNMYDGKMRVGYEWNEYPTYDAYESMMKEYANVYPDKCSLIELGTLGSGRKLLIIRINNGEPKKPKVLLTSTIHGDETTGFILMLRLIDELLTAEGFPEVDNIRNNVDLFICPNANPDGTYRKGNHTINGATRSNALGIDLNRNYPDCVEGNHPDDKNYALETELFMKFADEYQFTISANYHGGAEVVNYPWDNSTTRHVDDDWWQMISRQYADLAQAENPDYMIDRENGVTNGADWYMINGSRQDYMNYYEQCRELTVECSSVKCPPASELPLYWEYNRNSIYAFVNQVLYGIHGTVKDADTQRPLKASVKILNHDEDYSVVETQLPYGDFYRPIKSGNYTIEITADGYVPKRKDVFVSDNDKVTMEIELDKCEDFLKDYEADDFEIVTDFSENIIFIKTKESSQKIKWEVMNMQGQIVKKSCETSDNATVNLCEFNSGIYLLSIVIDNKQMGRKIVVR
jgi:hypothetical protein